MLINFCQFSMMPKVSCDCLCSEEHGVSNLISGNCREYSRGFLAYVVVKPPVRVEFELACHINLSHIVICTQVGGQKSTGLELYCKHSVKGDMQRIGRVELQHGECGVVFHHQHEVEEVPAGFACSRFISRAAALRDVSNVMVRIFRTHSSVPALGRVEVWGWINTSSTPSKLGTKLTELWSATLTSTQISDSSVSLHTKPLTLPNCHDTPSPSFVVPDDFLDCLTFELMTRPMTLPCGKVVDMSTLEKHEQCEASWGRTPSDPFTGRLLTASYCPVVNISLKARIDEFLVAHANEEEVRNLPRPLGRLRSIEESSPDGVSLVPGSERSKEKPGADETMQNPFRCTCQSVENFDTNNESHNVQSHGNVWQCIKELGVEEEPYVQEHLDKRKCTDKHLSSNILWDTSASVHRMQRKKPDVTGTAKLWCWFPARRRSSKLTVSKTFDCREQLQQLHGDKRGEEEPRHKFSNLTSSEQTGSDDENSLYRDVQAALGGLPTFLARSIVERDCRMCSTCSRDWNLYVLPCKHFVCRVCLTNMTERNNFSCVLCCLSFSSSDPVRYHP